MSIVVELHSPDRSDYPTSLLPPLGGCVALQAAKRQDRTGQDRCVCVGGGGGGGAWWPSGQDICPRMLKVVRLSPTSAWCFFIMHQPPSSPRCKMGTSLMWLGGRDH